MGNNMKEKDVLRIEQLEETLQKVRPLLEVQSPGGGWIRAIREALGMSGGQLARRLGKKASQTIEDMQRSEVTRTIKLSTLEALAGAMGCRLVYALVPDKSIEQLRLEQARAVARKKIKPISHSMRLEEQGVGAREEDREMERLVRNLLSGDPKKLWE